MKYVAALLLTCAGAAQAADIYPVPAEFWDRPRTGRSVLEQAVLKQAVTSTLAQPGSQIIVHHGYGQEALSQAEELRNWLMALAVEGSRIRLAGDPSAAGILKLEIVK